jgi:heat shock protein HslJ
MTHQHLTDLLERAADRIDVGAPPVDALLSGVRRRRRRHAALGGVGLTVVAVTTAIAVPVLLQPGDAGEPAHPQTATRSTTSPPPQAIDLEGRYIVVALVRRNGRPAPTSYGHTKFHLQFRETTMRAFDGCNELSGGYALRSDRFHLRRDVSITLVGCIPGPAPLFERLGDVVSVARDQGGTYLEDASGNVVIALVRR